MTVVWFRGSPWIPRPIGIISIAWTAAWTVALHIVVVVTLWPAHVSAFGPLRLRTLPIVAVLVPRSVFYRSLVSCGACISDFFQTMLNLAMVES